MSINHDERSSADGLSTLPLAEAFQAPVRGAARDFGRAPSWCRSLTYDHLGAPQSDIGRDDVVGIIYWEPGDLLAGTDSWSRWAVYPLHHGTSPEDPIAALSPRDVAGTHDLAGAAADIFGAPVVLQLDVMDYLLPEGHFYYPAFGVVRPAGAIPSTTTGQHAQTTSTHASELAHAGTPTA